MFTSCVFRRGPRQIQCTVDIWDFGFRVVHYTVTWCELLLFIELQCRRMSRWKTEEAYGDGGEKVRTGEFIELPPLAVPLFGPLLWFPDVLFEFTSPFRLLPLEVPLLLLFPFVAPLALWLFAAEATTVSCPKHELLVEVLIKAVFIIFWRFCWGVVYDLSIITAR